MRTGPGDSSDDDNVDSDNDDFWFERVLHLPCQVATRQRQIPPQRRVFLRFSSTLLQRDLPRGGRTLDLLLALGLQADLIMGREFGSHRLPYILENEAPTLQPEMQGYNCVTIA